MTAFPRALARHFAAAFVTLFTLACASTPSTPGGASNVPVVRPDTAIPIPQPSGIPPAAALPLNHSAGQFSYSLSQTTIVTVGSDSLGSLQDTLLTAATLRYSIQRPNDTLRITAVVDSLSVSSARDTIGPRTLLTPVSVQLLPVVDSQPLPITDSITGVPVGCDSMDDAARAIAHDILPALPPDVRSRQQWSDSSTRTVCRGGIPMTAVTVSTFIVQDAQPRGDSLIVQILRQSTLALSGAGTQGVRRISVSGTGTSETRFTYELRGGVFLESEGQSVLQLRFDTVQQTEQVTQRSMSRVHRRADRGF